MNSRRHFFKHMAGEIARGVQEIAAVSSSASPLAAPTAPASVPATTAPPRFVPATATARGASIEELLSLAADLDLAGHADAIRTLARPSIRLTPDDADAAPVAGGSRLGGAPDLPAGTPWPHWQDRPLEHRLQLDLVEVAATLSGVPDCPNPLPAHGTLWCFSAPEPPPGMRPGDAGACTVLLGTAPADAEPGYGHAVTLSIELVLPRAWSAPVDALALAVHEQQAWEELRSQLAARQGVAPTGGAPQLESLHRLLGWPDDPGGDELALACELLATGLDLGGESANAHPFAIDLAPRAGRWRPLLQLAVDEQVGWSWGGGRERLSVWVDEDALAACDLAGVRAFAQ